MEKFTFENTNIFNIILIEPCSIDNLNWSDPDYINKIMNMNIYKNLSANSDNFLDIVSDNLLILSYKDKEHIEVTTQLVAEFPNYIYEILYVKDLLATDGQFNSIGSLLNTNGDDIYGNVIIMKTYIPSLSKSIIIEDCLLINIKEILNNRNKTNIVIYDEKWSNETVSGSIDKYADDFFDDKYIKCEISFLQHNINIWYELCDGCSLTLCGMIIEKPIYKCLWFTKINDEYRGSLYLDEVQKIIKISNILPFPFNIKEEWIKDEVDEYKRNVIKNKYKTLDLVYHTLVENK
jgi:hypothetical protein